MSVGGPSNFEQAMTQLNLLLGAVHIATGNNLLAMEAQKKLPKPLYEQSLKQKALAQHDKNRPSSKPQHFAKRDTPINRFKNR